MNDELNVIVIIVLCKELIKIIDIANVNGLYETKFNLLFKPLLTGFIGSGVYKLEWPLNDKKKLNK